MNNKLLTRDEFRIKTLERDNFKCRICNNKAEDVHHIMDRKLFKDGGYYLNNAISLCNSEPNFCHLKCEQSETGYLPWDLYQLLKIDKDKRILPLDYDISFDYDKWGNILSNYSTEKADFVLHFSKMIKIPCTLEEMVHLSGIFDDDIILIENLETNDMFKGTIEDYLNK
jgi:hypothetical protein